MRNPLHRRKFLQQTTLTAAGLWLVGSARTWSAGSPNEKLNIGVIGVAGRAGDDLREVSSQNIVALCDIDDKNLAAAAQKYPGAKTYNDFRRLIDQRGIDAIVVGTPDHTHAVAAVAALKSGRHLYCEKPLARTISETRIITDTARKHKRITQIGTQIHAGTNYRRSVELVRSGAIGPVREVHVWVNATYGGHDLPKEYPPVPAQLHYDLWLGPVEYLPYSPEWVPFKWRNWWAFGGGALADFGCHYMDLPHWALDLRQPLSAEVVDGPPLHPDSTPPWLIVRYEHPARGEQPPVTLTWYHGGKQPSVLPDELKPKWKSGVLFIGSKGMLLADYGKRALLPEKDFAGFVPPAPFIKDSIGHHNEWIAACKTGGPTSCSFDYSGPLTETALLGNVAYRVGKKLEWDTKKLRATNCAEADQFIQHHYRKGWKLA
ncbi:MAG TPA: Gfo/Idh/MocA family oxidoreductase [Candidatus Eisenbacteria bacterium]|nr:Gfo/Idh/MocA family oxidoreductase [Candidatus Eisenbacteria bacterium]